MARWLKTDLIVCAQKVSNKEWEVTPLSSFSTSSSMRIATEDERNYFEEEGSFLGTVVSDAPFYRSSKSTNSSSNNSSSSKNMIYWAYPKYWPYLAAALNNSRGPESSKDDDPSFGEFMAESVPRQTVQNVLKRLGNKLITLENVFPLLKRSLLP